MHEQDMGSTTHVWVNGHWEDEFIKLAVVVIEVILAKILAQQGYRQKGGNPGGVPSRCLQCLWG